MTQCHSLFLGRDARLREVVLEMLDAAQGHDTLSLRGTATERLLRFVSGHVGVDTGPSTRFLGRQWGDWGGCACPCGIWGESRRR